MNLINLVLLGGPGSGKGTQAEYLKQEFALCHVSSGELFRDHLKHHTPLGQSARAYMDRGELVPDEVTDAMVEARLAQFSQEGFLLDGFPRTLAQAEALTAILARLDHTLTAVVYIHVPDEDLVERLSGRLLCSQCETSFHTHFRPPGRPGICDKCGGVLYQRDDDQPQTVRARLKTFHKLTEPVIDYYRSRGLLLDADGHGDVPAVWGRVRDAVRAVVDRSSQREGAAYV